MELSVHISSEGSLGEHSSDCFFNYFAGRISKSVSERLFLHSAYIIRMIVINLLIELLSGYLDLIRIESVINSYLGFCRDLRTYNKRKAYISLFEKPFWKYFFVKGHYDSVRLYAQYRPVAA